jgi:lysophospholipase L1-like esterase
MPLIRLNLFRENFIMKQFVAFLSAFVLCGAAVAQSPTTSKPAAAAENKEVAAEKKIESAAKAPAALKKGDRIVFLGDSITKAGLGPDGYITIIKKQIADKHKDLEIEVIGTGVSGNKVPDLQRRVDKDVIAKKPTIVFIYIGINDVWHSERGSGTPKDKYEAGLKEVIGKITAANARVILCTPTVIGEKPNGSNKLDAMLDEYADVSRAVAKELNVELLDLHKIFIDYLKDNNPQKKDAGILTSDRVHLSVAGNKLVAEAMLKVLGE